MAARWELNPISKAEICEGVVRCELNPVSKAEICGGAARCELNPISKAEISILPPPTPPNPPGTCPKKGSQNPKKKCGCSASTTPSGHEVTASFLQPVCERGSVHIPTTHRAREEQINLPRAERHGVKAIVISCGVDPLRA